jgi:hypothetical protein
MALAVLSTVWIAVLSKPTPYAHATSLFGVLLKLLAHSDAVTRLKALQTVARYCVVLLSLSVASSPSLMVSRSALGCAQRTSTN